MNNFFAQRLSFLLILAASTVVGSALSAQAQTINTGSTDSRAKSEEITKPSVSVVELAEAAVDATSPTSTAANVPAAETQHSLQKAVPAAPDSEQAQLVSPTEQQPPQTTAKEELATSNSVPVPGTTATSAATLTSESPLTPQLAPTSEKTTPKKVAQTDINPGGATRGGSSYVGIAGNFGITGGDQALGGTNFMVISKIGLFNTISARPSVVIGDDTTFLIPVTYDVGPLPIPIASRVIPISPYLGGGVAVATNGDVGPMIAAGVDVPVTPQFTATAGVNVGFLDDVNVGILVGVGYNFSGLFGL